MNRERDLLAPIEPDRHELHSPPLHHFELDRRGFFQVLGGGIAVLAVAERSLLAQEAGARLSGQHELPREISAWLHIGEDGRVTVFTGKVEVGQNIRTSLAQAVAEELRVPLDSIHMIMGDTDQTPFDMGTFGSRSTPVMGVQLRKVAAAAHDLLLDLAAETWKADRARLVAENGRVRDPQTGRTIDYAQLAKGRALAREIPETDPLRPAEQWTVAGKSLPKVDGRDFVTGKHSYASDVRLEGMLVGKVLRPPSFGATLSSLNADEAKRIPGVTIVRDGDFVGVAASTEQLAVRALDALRAEWKMVPQPSGKDLFRYLKENLEKEESESRRSQHAAGSIEAGLAVADHRLEQAYTVAYIAHAPLEPRAAVAQWQGEKLTVWTGTQRPFGVRSELAQAFRIPEASVHVLMPDTGSAYGGKHTGETATEAARLAKASGKPVRLVWTREEEFTWAYFRPAGVIEVRSGVRRDGSLTAWEFHNYNSGAAAISTPYDVANQLVEYHPVRSPLRQGSYRGLAATANHFARESHMDELAALLKMDALEFRLKNLKDARLRAVFEAAAKAFGWSRKKTVAGQGLPAQAGFGIAGGVEKGGYVATCAEVLADRASGAVKVVRLVTAFECGAIVNPDHLKNQVEGAVVMGLGGALFEAIEFENGRILNGRFSSYRVPRFSDLPKIEVVLLNRKDLPPAGAGETPIVGVAPAIAGAIFDATGVRLRSLPLIPRGFEARAEAAAAAAG